MILSVVIILEKLLQKFNSTALIRKKYTKFLSPEAPKRNI